MSMELKREVGRRRTFAIVSHPDAGKTTLTEKLLLYGGAVQLAGSVTGRKHQRATTSDWMELEKKRGISISSTVLNFDYRDFRINLLDTPGHKDFSEDTYRVLTAVDAVIMVIDAAKGVESQTRKLFEVCSRRGIPIFTFINKMDRPTREPLELLDELERVLGIAACPMNWPLGTGSHFKGLWERQAGAVHFFERTPSGKYRAPVTTGKWDDPQIRTRLSEQAWRSVREEMEILEGAGESFNLEKVLAGKLTPVYFGSALNNFGVQLLLDGFVELAPPPAARVSNEIPVPPDGETFSAFVFKIQANLDPKHRDRIAYLRIASGLFQRDMLVHHGRTGKTVRLANANKVFGRDRETVDEACAGDIVGIVGADYVAIGDTLASNPEIRYREIPKFPPECFAFLHNPFPSNYKRFRCGLEQLLQEGVVHSFELETAASKVALLAAVGPLQFEIVQYRLEDEYGAPSRLETAPWTTARWLLDSALERDSLNLMRDCGWALDREGNRVLLFPSDWHVEYFMRKNERVGLSRFPLDSREDLLSA